MTKLTLVKGNTAYESAAAENGTSPSVSVNHKQELRGNYNILTMVMVIYHYVVRIGEFSLPPILCITYTIMKNIIQVNHLIYIYNH